MSEQLLAEELAAVAAADPVLAALFSREAGSPEQESASIFAAPTLDSHARPLAGFHAEAKPYPGAARMGKITVTILGSLDSEGLPGGGHAARIEAVLDKFLGPAGGTPAEARANEQAAREAVLAAVNARGKVDLRAFGIAPEGVVADVDGEDLRAVLHFQAAWRILQPI